MTKNNITSLQENFGKVLIKDLSDDGVLCNFISKEYDEKGTFEGGSGDRAFFTSYNNTIIGFHEILSVLKGERRANIREAIPVIDFMDMSNTSIMSTYAYKDDSKTSIDPTVIVPILSVDEVNGEDSSYNYIVDEDPYIINRVIAGDSLREHFFNTKDLHPEEENLQVASYTGNYSYIYEGIKSRGMVDSFGNTLEESSRSTEIQTAKILRGTTLDFVPSTESGSCKPGEYDSKGTLFPDENTILGETSFVHKRDGYYTLDLASGDFIILAPGATYSADANKFLILKENPNNVNDAPAAESAEDLKKDTSGSNDPKFKTYVIYMKSSNYKITMDSVNKGDALPWYLYSNTIVDFLKKYLDINKEYYAPASGLLNGYFCKPKKRYPDTSNYDPEEVKGASTKVTRWSFCNDADLALEKNVVIDIGSKYNPNHLLSRGLPIVSPLALTSSDPTVDANGNPYEGKATIIYDELVKNADKLFDTVQIPKNEWYDFPLCRVDSVLKKSDYAGDKIPEKLRKSLLGTDEVTPKKVLLKPAKLRKNGQVLSVTDIEDYFERISSCLEPLSDDNSDFRLSLDFQNNPEVCCYNTTVKENSTCLNFGWAVKTKETVGTGNLLDSDFLSSFYAKWSYRWKWKRKKTANNCENLSIKTLSPLTVFGKKESDALKGTSMETNPDENIILIYPEYNKFLPSELFLISSIDLKLEPYVPPMENTEEESTEKKYSRGMCSFYNPLDGGKLISFRVEKVTYFFPSKVSSIKINDLYSKSTIYREIDHGDISGAQDCYIYTLKPMIMSMENIDIRDSNDNVIEASSGVQDVAMMPMAYPANYFPTTSQVSSDPENELGFEYIINSSHRTTDIDYLRGSYIIPGVPEFDDESELANISKNGLNLGIFADLFGKNGIGALTNNALKQGIRFALGKWPISDDNINPIQLENLSPILDGLLRVKPHLYNIISKGFEIPDESNPEKTRTIKTSDLSNFFTRIDTDDDYIEYSYKAIDPIQPNNISPDDSFSDILEKPLRALGIKTTGTSKVYERPSLVHISEVLKNTLEGDAPITRENCRLLDKYFGNDTSAFLEMGDPLREQSTPMAIINVSDLVRINVENVIRTYDIAYKNALVADKVRTRAGNSYRRFYTDESLGYYIDYKEDKATFDPEYPTNKFNSNAVYQISNPSALVVDIQRLYSDKEGTVPSGDYSEAAKEEYKKLSAKSGSSLRDVMLYFKNSVKGHDFWHWHWVFRWRGCSFNDFLRIMNFTGTGPTKFKWNDPWVFFWTGYWERKQMRNYLLTKLNSEVYKRAYSDAETCYKEEVSSIGYLEDSAIDDYLFGSGEAFSSEEILPEDDHSKATMRLTVKIPEYKEDEVEGKKVITLVPSNKAPAVIESPMYDLKPIDISMSILEGISKYVEEKLEGTGEGDYYVKYVEGDKAVTGRKNSLYYKRYLYLNNRMNISSGPLSRVSNDIFALNYSDMLMSVNEASMESYQMFLDAIPIKDMTQLEYFPPQKATATTISLENGKFYYKDELEALRKAIGDKCVLTCNRCPVKNSCIFYNENEILKMYCTPASFVSFYVKDNLLDLIVYDKTPGRESPLLKTKDGDYLDWSLLKEKHLPYSNVSEKLTGLEDTDNIEKSYNIRNLKDLEDTELKPKLATYDVDARGGIGWLLGARYGTVTHNATRELTLLGGNKLEKFKGNEIPTNKLMYDAVFIKDLNSEVTYRESTKPYKVTLEIGSGANRKVYEGSTRIYIPRSLKILDEADPEDDVFLISDDNKDPQGNEITPIIYLNKVKNLRYAFDLSEDAPGTEISYSDVEKTKQGDYCLTNGHVYAQDVAQWSINIAKGICADTPLGLNNENYDQYWMPRIMKKIIGPEGETIWVTINGRKRLPSGKSEPLVDPKQYDDALAISGKPLIASYVNFYRKFMINIEGDNVLWVKKNSKLVKSPDKDEALNDAKTIQKSIFPFMKTNLRLVVVRDFDNIEFSDI